MASKTKNKKTPYAHLFRLAHWLLSGGMIFLIFSGYGLEGVGVSSWSILDNYPSFYPGLRAMHWHKIIGIIFAPASIIALIFFVPKLANRKIANFRRIAAILLAGSAVVCAITSLGLIYTYIPANLYHTCRFLHSLCGLVIAPASLLIHICLALFRYFPLLVPSFAPMRQASWLKIVWFGIGLLLSWGLLTRYIPYNSGLSELRALKVPQVISDPENISLLPWDTATPLNMRLVNGVGFNSGLTNASMKALYNDTHIFMKIEWEDAVYNRIYRPWVKTSSGWMHLNPGGSDERIYNEDKFALIFPVSKDTDFQKYGCSVYCHSDQKNGHGRHWTVDNAIVDAWHWKSVRTDPIGNVDDKYWLGAEELGDDSEGRHGDPGQGGHANNLVDGVANPIMLPSGLDSITMGALIESKAEIFTKKAADKFPVGSEIPGAIISEAGGDRADIQCISTYKDGGWTLNIMRKLDTGSNYDVAFRQGEKYDFAAAAFDHAAFRHSYNHQVYRLHLIP